MKIGTRLILGFLTVALLVGLIGFFSISQSEITLKESLGQKFEFNTIDAMEKIDRDLHARIVQWELTGQSGLVKNTLMESNQEFEQLYDIQAYIDLQDEEWSSAHKNEITPFMQGIMNNTLSKELKARTNFLEKEVGFNVIGEVFITNKYGVNVAQTGKTTDYRQDDEEWWQHGEKSRLTVQGLEYDKSANVLSTDVIIRIEGDDGEFIGVMKVILNIEDTFLIIEEAKKHEVNNVNIFLVSKTAEPIYSTNGHEIFVDAAEREFFINLNADSDFYILPGSETRSETLVSYSRSLGYKTFEGLGWSLITTQKTDELLISITDLKNQVIIIAITLVILVVILALLVGFYVAQIISDPIIKLRNSADEIAKGNMDAQIDITSGDEEIRELAIAFDNMRNSLNLIMGEYEKMRDKNQLKEMKKNDSNEQK